MFTIYLPSVCHQFAISLPCIYHVSAIFLREFCHVVEEISRESEVHLRGVTVKFDEVGWILPVDFVDFMDM